MVAGFWEEVGTRLGLNVIKALETKKIVCKDCGGIITTRIIIGKHTTYHCNGSGPACGTEIIYHTTIDRPYSLRTFISNIENEVNKEIERRGNNLKTVDEYKKILDEIQKKLKTIGTAENYYKRWKARQNFKNALNKGVYNGRKA